MKHPFDEILSAEPSAAPVATPTGLVPAVSNRRELLKSALYGSGAMALLAGCDTYPDATTLAVGEEGGHGHNHNHGPQRPPMTRRYGESGEATRRMGEDGNITTRGPGGYEDGATTLALQEEGGAGNTMATYETGGPGAPPRGMGGSSGGVTTYALGEEG